MDGLIVISLRYIVPKKTCHFVMWTQPPKFYDVIQSIQRLLEYTEGREYEIQGGGALKLLCSQMAWVHPTLVSRFSNNFKMKWLTNVSTIATFSHS